MPSKAPTIPVHQGDLSSDRLPAELPIVRVTVLEDRAQVERRSRLQAGDEVQRFVVEGVSPCLHDVSLRGEAAGAQVTTRVVRARRIHARQRPEAVAELEAELDQLEARMEAERDRLQRAQQRHERVASMLTSAAMELPEDASWGRGDAASWRHAFERLFERSREEDGVALEAHLAHERLLDEWRAVKRRLDQVDGPSSDLQASLLIDLVGGEGEVEITVRYVVPAALWRPLHRAELSTDGKQVHWTPRACVWQRTGESWNDVELVLSTARTSSGTEPPLLVDDPLQVRKKQEGVQVAIRDVDIQSTGPGGDGGPPELPGVDDGGEARHLGVEGRVRVASTGRPTFFDLAPLQLPCEVELTAKPEVAERVVRRVVVRLAGSDPLLPGPVELLRNGGPFATSTVDFTAPGATSELSFGPDDDARVQRDVKVVSDKRRTSDGWRLRTEQIRVFLSNVGTETKRVHVVERVPISEIEQVRIADVVATPPASPDDHGHVHWEVEVPPNAEITLELRYTLATAPDVTI